MLHWEASKDEKTIHSLRGKGKVGKLRPRVLTTATQEETKREGSSLKKGKSEQNWF